MVTHAHIPPRSLRILPVIGGLVLGLVIATVLYTHDPVRPGLYPPCPFHWATGLLCPGCGTLRGLHQLLHGHLLAAFRLNPLMVLSLPFLGWVALASARARLRGVPRCRLQWRWLGWAVLAVVLAHGITRNLV